MTHAEIGHRLSNDSGIRLLRSGTAPLVLGFLSGAYKTGTHSPTLPLAELEAKLDRYLRDLRAYDPELYPRSASEYLAEWCNDDHRYLRRFYDGDVPVAELTAATERVLGWVRELGADSLVGTESRFRQLFGLLEQLLDKGTEDPAARVRRLEAERARLQAEIEAIRATGEVERFSERQVREWFDRADREARGLLGDFRAVAERFRDIAREAQERQLREGGRRGDVLGHVLDAEDGLRESPQGQSFYAFWRFLRSPDQKRELHELLDLVFELPGVRALEQEDSPLREVVVHLAEAGAKVVRTHHQLAASLRRMMDEGEVAETRRVIAIADEVRRLALRAGIAAPVFLEVEGAPALHLPLERPPWEPSAPAAFPAELPEAADEGGVPFDDLLEAAEVSRAVLWDRVRGLLDARDVITLGEVVGVHPIERGLAELLGYVALAAEGQAEGHVIDEAEEEAVPMRSVSGAVRLAHAPAISFSRSPLPPVASPAP